MNKLKTFKEFLKETYFEYPRWVTIDGKHIYLKNQYSFDYGKFIGKASEKQKLKITDDEKNSLDFYTGNGYHNINRYLRTGTPTVFKEEKLKEHIKNIDALFDKNPLKDDSLLYTKQKVYRVASNKFEEEIKSGNLKEGYEFTEPAYSSTTKSKKQALNFSESTARGHNIIFVINAKKGQKAIDISEHSEYGSEENEVLIARNSKFKVKKIEEKQEEWKWDKENFKKSVKYIYMDIIEQ